MQTIITTAELFKLLSLSIGKEKPATPYMVAKIMGVSPGTAGDWMRGYRVMTEEHGEKAAELINMDNDFVQLSLEAERKNKSGLDKIAAIFERAALAVANHGHAAAIGFLMLAALPHLLLRAPELCILC